MGSTSNGRQKYPLVQKAQLQPYKWVQSYPMVEDPKVKASTSKRNTNLKVSQNRFDVLFKPNFNDVQKDKEHSMEDVVLVKDIENDV